MNEAAVSEAAVDSPWLIVAIIVAFFVIFPLFWSAISGLLAGISGWSGLARRYGWQGETPASSTTTSGRIGLVNYNGILELGQDRSFVYLAVFPIFPFHRTLRIPREDLVISGPTRFFFMNYMLLDVKNGPTIRVHARAWDETVGRH